jgi:hypothetical protein
MNKYTIYHNTDGVIATGKPYPTDEGAEIPNLAPELNFLLEVTEARPTYDSATHKLVEDAINYDTVNKTATRSWSVVALTQAEIDERTPAHVEIGGIKYDTSETSQNAFTRMMTLVSNAGMALTDEVAVKDCLGVSHTLTVEQFNADMVQFGLYCYTQFHS